jgi:aspartyl-tRNA(Asn)/glutamyl-tRNA(Gln) amidotransferase subunit A
MSPSAVTARALAQSVRSGERSAVSVVDEALDAIDRGNERVNALVTVMDEQARLEAAAIDRLVSSGGDPGPLAGVPVALKDNLCTRGVPTSCGSRILHGWLPPYDATVVRRLRQAGAVVVGKANMDEFAMGSSTESSWYGPTRNPHDLSRVPGGSSGGSAAAVAAGFVPLALGSDTGGSIRQPAALCGVVGAKPTYGLVSRYGLVAFASSLDQIGPFARSVDDAALLLQVVSGHDPCDSTSYRESVPEFTDGLGTRLSGAASDLGGLRVGFCTELVDGVAADVAARARQAADSLAAGGANVEEISVPELRFGLSAYYLIAPAEASSNLARYDGVRYGLRVDGDDVGAMNTATRTAGFGAEVKRRIMLGTYALSAGYYDAYYGQAQRVRTLVIDAFARAYTRFDVLIGATAPTTAFRIGEKIDDPMAMYMSDVCTIPSNLAGHPAISVPFGVGDDGLPVGLQVLAPALGEPVMFRVATALEARAPGSDGSAVATPSSSASTTSATSDGTP